MFPNAPRTIYRRNPLEEVICQLRFPAILRIDAEAERAATFQEGIRGEYPLYEEQALGAISTIQLPAQLQRLIPAPSGQLERHFSSEDQLWRIALTRDFIALTTKAYDRWESFRRHLDTPIAAFEQTYAPSFYSRVGLRYMNVIRRSRYGLAGVPWAELLRPHIAGEFSSSDVAAGIRHTAHQVSFELDGGATVQLRHGLTKSGDEEQCYTIDADFFVTGRMEPNNATGALDFFNEQARRLFLWCISDRLHEVLAHDSVAA
jgi:uncharacterized protein (TIGR04255 family)